jgi:glycerate 2-kinase
MAKSQSARPGLPTPVAVARDARKIFKAAVAAASPKEAVARQLSIDPQGKLCLAGARLPLDSISRVWVVGAGKATAPMAQAVEKLLGKRIAGGAIIVKYGHGAPLRRVQTYEAGHPVPDEAGVRGADAVSQVVAGAEKHDLVIALISGGASALMVCPAGTISLQDKQECTRLLLASGASIHEMNAVRKHLSQLKGGQLAALASPARVWALLLSDVIGDDLDVIGSGPCAPDASTFADALRILRQRGIFEQVPASVRDRLERGAAGELPETPKPGDPRFQRVQNVVVGSNARSVEAAAEAARDLGYRPLVLTTTLDGEAREQARMLVSIAKEVQRAGRPAKAPLCLLAGGETVVTLRGNGKGGRNQEFALAAALALRGTQGISVLAAGTDGTDGPTDAAGAVVSGATVDHAASLGFDVAAALANNDAYPLLQATREAIHTGPTGTNVMDLYAALVRPATSPS